MDNLNSKNITEADVETFRTIVERSPDPAIIHDGERVLYANPKVLEYVSLEHLMKRKLVEFIHPDYRAVAVERIAKVMKGEEVEPYEEIFILPDGREVWFETNPTPITFKGKRAVLLILRDVTARRKTEERYREFFDNSLDIIAVTDLKGNHIEVNKAFEEAFGYSQDEVIGRNFAEVLKLSKEAADEVYRAYNRAFRERRNLYGLLFKVKRKDSREIFVEGNVRLLWEGDKITGFIGNFRDVTERIKLEKRLRESEEKYRSIFNYSPLAIIVFDDRLKIVDWNRRAEEIFGWKKEEVLGKNVVELIVPEPLKDGMQQIAKRMAKGEIYTYSINDNLTKDGRTITCEWHNTIYRDAEGKIYCLSIASDVTEKIKMERELKESEERYRAIFMHSPILIAILDKEGRFVEANPAMVKSIGENPIGKTLSEIFPTDVAERRFRHLKKALEEDSLVEFEDERSGKHFINFFLPIEVKGEKHCLIIAQEITELRKLTKLLREMVEVNEAIVRIREREELVKRVEEILSDYSAKIVEKPSEGECLEIRYGEKTYGFLSVKNVDEEMKSLLRTLTDDIAFAFKSMEDEEKRDELFKQLVENIRTIAYLIDRIRNPLTVIRGFAEVYIKDEEVRNKIIMQIDRIMEIVENLDISWAKSERIAKIEEEIYDLSKIEEEFKKV